MKVAARSGPVGYDDFAAEPFSQEGLAYRAYRKGYALAVLDHGDLANGDWIKRRQRCLDG